MATGMKTVAPTSKAASLAVAGFGRMNAFRQVASKGFAASRNAQLKTMAAVQFDYDTKV